MDETTSKHNVADATSLPRAQAEIKVPYVMWSGFIGIASEFMSVRTSNTLWTAPALLHAFISVLNITQSDFTFCIHNHLNGQHAES